MPDTADALDPEITPAAVERRMERNILLASTLTVLIAASFSGWKAAAGAAAGGALSYLNYRWMHSGLSAMIALAAQSGQVPGVYRVAAKFLLRWFVIIGFIWLVSELGGRQATMGAIAGLFTIALAALVEGAQEVYLILKRRELKERM